MRKVIGIGETVLDIIFKGGKPIEAVPGGSSFNAVISLGRAGVNASFISEAGNDRIGEYVIQFLRDNGVNADNVSIFPESKSPLSLAFLDENNNADYIFYKDHPHDQLEFATPEINPGDIVLFGSFFALNPVVRPQVAGFLEYAKEHGAILYYDINFRASHQNEIMKITPNLIENLEMADFVRGSHEDFGILYKKPEADKVYNAEISFYCKKFICTQGAEPVEVRAENGFAKSYPSEKMKPVSTIGAGDNFNAGFLVSSIVMIMPIAFATMMEHVGDISAIGGTIGKNLIEDPGLHRTLMGDGLATAFAGMFGGPANTTYGENTGVLALSKVYDPRVIRLAAVYAIILSFSPKFDALVNSIPTAIVGGVSFILYGMISAVGVRNIVENQVDLTKSRNLIIAAVMFVSGLGFSSVGGVTFTVGGAAVTLSGLAIAALCGVILNAILPGNDYEFGISVEGDKSADLGSY